MYGIGQAAALLYASLGATRPRADARGPGAGRVTLRAMAGALSGIATVAVFAAVAALGVILAAKLYRAGSAAGPPRPGGS
jgi:hypothetical protein